MIDSYFEEALDRVGMQVNRYDAVGSYSGEHIGNHLGEIGSRGADFLS